jgi:hypothetical protein
MVVLNQGYRRILFVTDMLIKTYRKFFCLLFLSILVACNKQDNPAIQPSIELMADSGYIGGTTTLAAGALLKFKLNLTEGSEKLTNFYLEVSALNQPPKRYFDTAMYVSNIVLIKSFYKSPEPVETWSFVVRDRQGGSNSVAVQIMADTNSVYGPLLNLSHIVMGAQNNIQTGSCYSFEIQKVYTVSEAKENQDSIDMVFYYGVDELTIASPGANIESGIFPEDISPLYWEVRNTTWYIKTTLNENDFNNATNDSIMIANYVDANGKRKAKILTAGDIYVFKNQQNRLGLFKVNSASGTDAGLVDIDVKIQVEEE